MRKALLNLQIFMVTMWEVKQELLKITKQKRKFKYFYINVFPSEKPKYALLVMLENPQIAKNLIYDYKGLKIKASQK